jgi:hypothetical protein
MSRRPTLILAPVAAALLLGACSGSTTPPGSPAASEPAATATAAPTSTPATSSPAEGSAAPTALDPCQLVTAAEASALAGTSFGTGKEETTSGGAKICVYGSATTSVVQVIVAQAADAATAQANWAQEQAQAEAAIKQGVPSGVNFTLNVNDASVTGADRAAVASAQATIGGVSVAISAIYVLKGATFFTFSDLGVGHAAASTSALEAQAVTTLGRIP